MMNSWGTLPYSLLIMLLIVMLSITFIMYKKWTNRTYFNLTLSFLFGVLAFVGMLATASGTGKLSMFFTSLTICSYVTIQVGLFRVFNPRRDDRLYVHLSVTAVSAFLASASLYVHPVLSAYLTGLLAAGFSVYSIYKFKSEMTKRPKYLAGMSLFGGASVFQTAGVLSGVLSLKFLGAVCLLLAYYFIFMLLFERIIELMQAATYTSSRDGLTGLLNRRYFTQQVNQAVSGGTAVGAIFFDIDNFKKLNDTYGHEKGDETLKAVADILQKMSENAGFAGRYGGEEMVVFVTSPSVHPGELAERMRARVQAETGVTVSVGFANHTGDISAAELIKMADEAMYAAKTKGKNKVVEYAGKRPAHQR